MAFKSASRTFVDIINVRLKHWKDIIHIFTSTETASASGEVERNFIKIKLISKCLKQSNMLSLILLYFEHFLKTNDGYRICISCENATRMVNIEKKFAKYLKKGLKLA